MIVADRRRGVWDVDAVTDRVGVSEIESESVGVVVGPLEKLRDGLTDHERLPRGVTDLELESVRLITTVDEFVGLREAESLRCSVLVPDALGEGLRVRVWIWLSDRDTLCDLVVDSLSDGDADAEWKLLNVK